MSLEELYKKYNFPGLDKFYQIVKKNGIDITKKELSQFIKKQFINQVYTKKSTPPKFIISYSPHTRIQMDIVDMTRYKSQNKGYSYLFFIIDIFTRKVYAYPLKSREKVEVETAFKEYIKETQPPETITSDNEGAFTSQSMDKIYDKYGIFHHAVDVGNHKALGVLDSAVKTLKGAIVKHMENDNNPHYLHIKDVVKAYNDTPHSGILDLTPDEVAQKGNEEIIQALNHKKYRENQQYKGQAFKKGDVVRVEKKKGTFNRAYDRVYGRNTHTIKEITMNHALLENNKTVSLRRLKRVEDAQLPNVAPVNEIKKAHTQKKADKIFKKEDLNKGNIIQNRTRGRRVQAVF